MGVLVVGNKLRSKFSLPFGRDTRRVTDVAAALSTESLASRYVDRVALSIRSREGWRDVSFRELHRRAHRLAEFFIDIGVTKGTPVAVLADPSPEWVVGFFGVVNAGAILVPLDVKLGVDELAPLLRHCQASVLLFDTKYTDTARALADRVPSLTQLLVVASPAALGQFRCIDQLTASHHPELPRLGWDDTALIVYLPSVCTRPKGAMITVGNLAFQSDALSRLQQIRPSDRLLHPLPLNHLFSLTCGVLAILAHGASVCFASSLFPQDIVRLMRERRITMAIAVPLILRMLQRHLERERSTAWPRWLNLVRRATTLVPVFGVSLLTQWRLRCRLGGKLRVIFTGAAPLDPTVGRFFINIGIPVVEGYGMTEAGPVITTNSVHDYVIGSVGRPLPGIELKLGTAGGDGIGREILTRGPHVMKGYLQDRDLTASTIDSEGWLHSGDLGRIVGDRLYITGRLKNLIVLGGGKKVDPREVETAVAQAPAIKKVRVFSRASQHGLRAGTEEVCALVVPTDSVAREYGSDADGLRNRLESEVLAQVRDLAPYKRPTAILVDTATSVVAECLPLRDTDAYPPGVPVSV